MPTFVATLAICIVFVPVLLLTGAARYLFTPLAMAVVFAMLASYLLSRTLVPTMVAICSRPKSACTAGEEATVRSQGIFWRIHHMFNHGFEALRYRYVGLLDWSLRRRGVVLTSFMAFRHRFARPRSSSSAKTSFPTSMPARSACMCALRPARALKKRKPASRAVEREIRSVIPPSEIDNMLDNIGIPNSWTAIAQGDPPNISSADGEIYISLKPRTTLPPRDYEVILRKHLHDKFPDMTFFFQPANITTQILNFGLPAPIDVQVVGRDSEAGYKIAQKLAHTHRRTFPARPTFTFTRWSINR